MSLTLKRVLRVASAILAWLIFDFGIFYFGGSLVIPPGRYADSAILEDVLSVLLVGGNLLIPILFVYYRHKRRGIWLKEEAERWLARRSAEPLTLTQRRLQKIRRAMLWVPSLFALTVFLFLPESWGIASHVFEGGSVDLDGSRVAIPLTWVIKGKWNHSEGSFASIIVGRGIGRVGFGPYLRQEELIASVGLTGSTDEGRNSGLPIPQRGHVLATRTVALGGQTLLCRQFTYREVPPLDSDDAQIDCASPTGNVFVYFYGSPTFLPKLYEFLEGAAPRK